MSDNNIIINKLNGLLAQLEQQPNLNRGLDVANGFLGLLTRDSELQSPVDIISDRLLDLPTNYHDSWFKKHPTFESKRACFSLVKTDLLEANFYWLNSQQKRYIIGVTGFYENYEDSEYTRRGDKYKVGLHFLLSPSAKTLTIVVGNRDNIRVIEVGGKLNSTQAGIFNDWVGFNQLKTKQELHQALWSGFKLQTVNQEFYKGLSDKLDQFIQSNPELNDTQSTNFMARLICRLLFCWFLTKKGFIDDQRDYFNPQENDNQYYRDKLKSLFFGVLNTKESDRFRQNLGVDYDRKTPYLNGGLFQKHSEDTELTVNFPRGFFQQIYQHFNKFNFTVDESSTEYEQLAIDPEMLGRVLENLLARRINPVTSVSSGKEKGVFYTPRPIVKYMCEESLKNYLIGTKPDNALYAKNVTELIEYSDKKWIKGGSNSRRDLIKPFYIDHIKNVLGIHCSSSNSSPKRPITVLDPACGSGAFLIGMMQLLIKIHSRIGGCRDLYQCKKQILKNNIFGVDIDPMAVEISKLRAWLSLIIDVKKIDKVEPLPNLDFKFVAANSLIPLASSDDGTLAYSQIRNDINHLAKLRSSYFFIEDKKLRKKAEKEILSVIKKITNKTGNIFKNEELTVTTRLKKWNPFDNNPTDWFDAELIFGVNDGFDIVIANPPYIQLQKNGGELGKRYKDVGYQSFASTGDIYALFYEKGYNLLNSGGVLAYITSNKWMRAKYGTNLRKFFSKGASIIKLIDLGPDVFETATVDANILIAQKTQLPFTKPQACSLLRFDNKNKLSFSRSLIEGNSVDFVLPGGGNQWLILSPIERSIKEKVEKYGTPLKEWDINIYRGLLTGYNKAFIIDNETKQRLIKEDPKSAEILKPVLRGKDISRYQVNWAGLWLVDSHNGYGDVQPVDINNYPSIKKYLDSYIPEITTRQDRGATYYNMRNCAYHEQFEKPKIIYRNLAGDFVAVYDNNGFFTNQKCFMVTGGNLKYLTLFFNSSINNFYFKKYLGVTLGQAFEMSKFLVDQIPAPKPNPKIQSEADCHINKLLGCPKSESVRLMADRLFYSIYNLTKEEIVLIQQSN